MKIIKKNVYYCEFCNKRGLSGGSMAKHEKHCTANPDRKCRLCDELNVSNNIKILIEKYKTRYTVIKEETEYGLDRLKVKWQNEPVTFEEILKDCKGCPNCALTVLRCSGMGHLWFDIKFDYKKILLDTWAEINAEKMAEEEKFNYYNL